MDRTNLIQSSHPINHTLDNNSNHKDHTQDNSFNHKDHIQDNQDTQDNHHTQDTPDNQDQYHIHHMVIHNLNDNIIYNNNQYIYE